MTTGYSPAFLGGDCRVLSEPVRKAVRIIFSVATFFFRRDSGDWLCTAVVVDAARGCVIAMIFRCRMYRVKTGKSWRRSIRFFLTRLLPVQGRYGAILIGRWSSDDKKVIFALWAYESTDAYHTIQNQVSSDPDSIAAQTYRREKLEPLFTETEEWLMTSTVPLCVDGSVGARGKLAKPLTPPRRQSTDNPPLKKR